MKRYRYILAVVVLLGHLCAGCVSSFEPEGIADTSGILVVEGMILEPTGSKVKLSRTKELTSDKAYEKISHAKVYILSDNDKMWEMEPDPLEQGVYILNEPLTYESGVCYALDIYIDNSHYQSEYVLPVKSPEIDDLSWTSEKDNRQVNIRVSTHDSENKVKYFLWEYTEDWEYRAQFAASLRWNPDKFRVERISLSDTTNTYYCWGKDKSRSLILGTTEKFSESRIQNKVIKQIEQGTRLSFLYSILVKQYALSESAYAYFSNLQKNVEESGSVFAPQPTEMEGNIKNMNKPEEPVVGYFFASTENSERLYISVNEVPGITKEYDCTAIEEYEKSYAVVAYANGMGIMSEGSSPDSYMWVAIRCVDCTKHGGTKKKPEWWPNNHL